MLNRLVKEDVLVRNPVSRVRLLNENNLQYRVLTYSEETIYLVACGQPLRDFAVVMIETGLRPDEVRRLTIRDVFVEKGHLEVLRPSARLSTALVGGRSYRGAGPATRRGEGLRGPCPRRRDGARARRLLPKSADSSSC
jgi:integrase